MEEPQGRPALAKNLSTENFKKPSCHVVFEVPSHRHITTSDIGSSIDHLEKGRYHPRRFACCAWSCIIIFICITVLLFAGISYLAFLKAGLPKVNVRMISISKLQLDNSQKMDTKINLGLIVSNKNEKLKLLYGPLSIDVTSEDVPLGRNKLNEFSQLPQNVTFFNVAMSMDDASINKFALDDLKSDINAHEMVFDVYVSGQIGFQVGGLHMNNVPFLASCLDIKRLDVDMGRKPQCDVKMFSFRPTNN